VSSLYLLKKEGAFFFLSSALSWRRCGFGVWGGGCGGVLGGVLWGGGLGGFFWGGWFFGLVLFFFFGGGVDCYGFPGHFITTRPPEGPRELPVGSVLDLEFKPPLSPLSQDRKFV